MTVLNYADIIDKEQINILIRYCLEEGLISIDTNKITINKNKKEKITKEWIKEWNSLFPISKDTYNRENLRDSIPGKYGVKNKMEGFLKEYDYSLEVIMEATKCYLNNQKTSMYKTCKRSGYFISKSPEPSRLAAECEKYITEGDVSKVQDKIWFGEDLN